MRLSLPVALVTTLAIVGGVSADGPTPRVCNEQPIPLCCTVFAKPTNAAIQAVFGDDPQLPTGNAGIYCSLPSADGSCGFFQTQSSCHYFSTKLRIAAGCS